MLKFFLVAHLTYENHWGKWHSKIWTFGFFGTPYCEVFIAESIWVALGSVRKTRKYVTVESHKSRARWTTGPMVSHRVETYLRKNWFRFSPSCSISIWTWFRSSLRAVECLKKRWRWTRCSEIFASNAWTAFGRRCGWDEGSQLGRWGFSIRLDNVNTLCSTSCFFGPISSNSILILVWPSRRSTQGHCQSETNELCVICQQTASRQLENHSLEKLL